MEDACHEHGHRRPAGHRKGKGRRRVGKGECHLAEKVAGDVELHERDDAEHGHDGHRDANRPTRRCRQLAAVGHARDGTPELQARMRECKDERPVAAKQMSLARPRRTALDREKRQGMPREHDSACDLRDDANRKTDDRHEAQNANGRPSPLPEPREIAPVDDEMHHDENE